MKYHVNSSVHDQPINVMKNKLAFLGSSLHRHRCPHPHHSQHPSHSHHRSAHHLLMIFIFAILCSFFINGSSAASPPSSSSASSTYSLSSSSSSSSSSSPSTTTGHLIVLTPKVLRASQTENILLIYRRNDTSSLISDDTQSIIIQVHDSNSLLFERTLEFIAPNVPHLVPITVSPAAHASSSDDASNGNNNGPIRSVIISVILSEGSDINKQILRRELKILPATGFAFIQTDKPIYSPRDVLKIRLLKLDDSLKPATEEQLKLRIKNPQQIIVEEKIFNSNQVFIDHEFMFTENSPLGTWTALVLYGQDFSSNSSVTFDLAEYVLPTFSVSIDIHPKVILPSTYYINGTAIAKYVYGKPVEGTMTFRFGVQSEAHNKMHLIGHSELKNLNKDGKATFRFKKNDIMESSTSLLNPDEFIGAKLYVEATVTESSSQKKEKASDNSVSFDLHAYKVSFEESFKEYVPNIETYVLAKVSGAGGEPASNVPLTVTMMDNRDKAILVNGNQTTATYETDSRGRVYIPLKITDVMTTEVTIRAVTADSKFERDEQGQASHKLRRQESDSGFISFAARRQNEYSVNEIFESDLIIARATAIDAHHIYYAIVDSKGHIINASKLEIDGYIRFRFTKEMVPKVRVVVIAYNKLDNLMSDSLTLRVRDNDCGLRLSITHPATNTVDPNKLVNMRIEARERSRVSLIGVDEAVYALKKNNQLTKRKLSSELSKRDAGCGPGGGRNPLDVILNSGLTIMSDNPTPASEEGTHCHAEESAKPRAKRSPRSMMVIAERYDGMGKTCCMLALRSDPSNTCEARVDIVKKWRPTDIVCHRAFLNCCKRADLERTSTVHAPPLMAQSTLKNVPEVFQRKGTSVYDQFLPPHLEDEYEGSTLIRNDFRETWLFDLIDVDESGVAEHRVRVPHSITTWQVNGMSVGETGLCLTDSPLRVVTFQEIFLQVHIPYNIVQNEQLEVLATVYNYGSRDVACVVYIYGSQDYCSEVDPGEKSRKQVRVRSNSAQTVVFPIVPLRTGAIKVKTVVLSVFGTDVVEKNLHVIPQGIKVEDDLTFHLDPLNKQRRKKRSIITERLRDEIDENNGIQRTEVKLSPSAKSEFIVPKTQECIVSAIGDKIGQTATTTLEDIDNLIRQPKGCGEQTMIYMAPTFYTAKYLYAMNRLNGDLKYRAAKYIQEGYQRELDFRKSDGSFSGFPTAASSLWLTSFVTKVFCQVRQTPFLVSDVYIDDMVVDSAIDWIIKQQSADGSWTEAHAVYHREMIGGVKGKVPLTAYNLITLRECEKKIPFRVELDTTDAREREEQIKRSIRKSEEYLLSHQNDASAKKDAYVLALMAYSLGMGNANSAANLMHELLRIANYDSDSNQMYWRNHHKIEATAYGLLALLSSQVRNSLDTQSVANWLTAQRSFTGSFDTTQDTIIALEALTQFSEAQAILDADSSVELICNVTTARNRFRRSIHFNESNALVMQEFKVEADDPILEFVTQGNGVGVMSVKLRYNVLDQPEKLCKFNTDVNVTEWRNPHPSKPRSDDDDEENLGDDMFEEIPDGLLNELGVNRSSTFRGKRSLPFLQELRQRWADRLNRLGLGWAVAAREAGELTAKQHVGRRSPSYDLDDNGFNDLSKSWSDNSPRSKLVLEVKICTQYMSRQDSEMTIIEVGILTGFSVVKDDLDSMKRRQGTFVSNWELKDDNLVIYLEKVPHAKRFCLRFRLVREHQVENIQPKVVRVYDYYKPEHGCSQLYSPSRITDLLEIKCQDDSKVCQCVKRNVCPTTEKLDELAIIGSKDMQQARTKLKALICRDQYDFAWIATVRENKTLSKYTQLQVKLETPLKGEGRRGQPKNLLVSDDCFSSVSLSSNSPHNTDLAKRKFLVIGSTPDLTPEFNNGAYPVDASLIIYDITSPRPHDLYHNLIIELAEWLKEDVERSGLNCQAT